MWYVHEEVRKLHGLEDLPLSNCWEYCSLPQPTESTTGCIEKFTCPVNQLPSNQQPLSVIPRDQLPPKSPKITHKPVKPKCLITQFTKSSHDKSSANDDDDDVVCLDDSDVCVLDSPAAESNKKQAKCLDDSVVLLKNSPQKPTKRKDITPLQDKPVVKKRAQLITLSTKESPAKVASWEELQKE